ncbi:MAG: ABC transporter ATP-binding protein [Brevibacterium sp.]|nr:ABC transporter ATP-binding protein [Brevibacterium sp.]MDN5832447.1 ABC transporter ATP-binding protein [Brevibacterium sp.]MDN5908821.1 ABC transporter ATP-binding protein [Brevibacterium sp.]MDN6122761.1 ABC transporter ATP-binding protein [Brevibacterium sp.]MDN6133737.1 ABC transporter ATP-binding protein [Brevibacterium sp.]
MAGCIDVSNLSKRYGDFHAVSDLSFSVEHGEIFGLLGPNGAGKTTTLEMIAGIRRASSGQVAIMGHDPHQDRRFTVEHVALQQQESSVFQYLTVSELVELHASFYPDPRKSDDAIEFAGLLDHRDQRFAKLSGGQKRRLAFSLAVVGNTDILILDEPAAGLDPAARTDLQASIRQLQTLGKTILYTTHHLEEATELCDRVAIMVGGRMQISGSPSSLINQFDATANIDFTLLESGQGESARAWCETHSLVEQSRLSPGGIVTVTTEDSDSFVRSLHHSDLRFKNLRIRSGSLNDVYTSLVKGD